MFILRGRTAQRSRRRVRPQLEWLEDRRVLSTVNFTIDPQQDVAPISPFIYGVNQGLSGAYSNNTLERLGGNRWTAYNWENNASNAGSDWNYQNDDYLGGGTTPGGAVMPALQDAAAHNAGAIVTVPINGYVAADKNGGGDVRNSGSNYLQTRFKQELPQKGSAFTLNPDPNDPYVYQDEFVNWVNTNYPYGQTDPNRPIIYELDNEPDLWSSTHAEIHPNPTTYAELVQDTIAYASAIKAVAPNSLVFGPVNYGWEGYVDLQGAPDANGRDFQDYYLQQMQTYQSANGQRLIDALDVHWYPEATGGGVRITGQDTTPAVVAARLQAPRSLWDPNYTETSWITQWSTNGPIDLIPRLDAKINANYPGTKLAFTEYNYGAGDDISGGIAEADVLGIFGRYGVYAANEWALASNEAFIGGAFEMYRNFDGHNGTFGNTSVHAATNDVADSSVYASIDSANPHVMTLVVLNKTNAPLTAHINLNNVAANSTAAVYQLTSASPNPQYAGQTTIADPSNYNYTMPAYSVSTIRILIPGVSAYVGNGVLQVAGDPTAADNVTLRLKSGDPTHTEVLSGSTVVGSFANSAFSKINVALGGGNDKLTLDASNGSPVPSGGIRYDGGAGTNTLLGPNTNNTWSVTATNAGNLNTNSTFVNVQNLTGGSGSDSFVLNNTFGVTGLVDGGSGSNTLDYSHYTTAVSVNLSKGTATKTGSITRITNVVGGAGNDTFTAGAGNETFTDSTGSNTYVFVANTNLGSDTINDNSGKGTISFAGTTAGCTLDLSKTTAQAVNANLTLTLSSAAGIRSVVGSNGDDVLTGNALNNTFTEKGGNNTLTGNGGSDTYTFAVNAGSSSDTINDSSGKGTISFAGTTAGCTLDLSRIAQQTINANLKLTLSSAVGIRSVFGGNGNDVFTGNSLNNTFTDNTGSNTYLFVPDTALGSDTINDKTGKGTISFAGTNSDVTLNLGLTTRQTVNVNLKLTLSSASGILNATGGNGNDKLTGNGLLNILRGGAGDDTLTSGSAGGVLVGGAGSNTLIGGAGRSLLIAGSAASTATGGAKGDIVLGGTTSFDLDNIALMALLTEWQRTDIGYSQRISDLRNGVVDANGHTDQLAWGTTVLSNGASNALSGQPAGTPEPGGAELDWFFANLAAGHDRLLDHDPSEVVD